MRYFSTFSELYGSLGAVVALMMWFWMSAFVVLLGAEINCEMERQTYQDTTTGEPRLLGERDAFAADTVGVKTPGRIATLRIEQRRPPSQAGRSWVGGWVGTLAAVQSSSSAASASRERSTLFSVM